MNIKISIVVPVYRVEDYLRRCINSILNQTYKNLEIILVDDGSPDKSGEICDEYKKLDERIIVIHQENKGLSGARNAGIDIATGEYIGFVDSDDYINERMYEVLLKNALENDSDISCCRFIRFKVDTVPRPEEEKWGYNTISTKKAIINLHGRDGQVYAVAWNKLYHIKLFSNLRYPLRKLNEDESLIYKLIDKASNVTVTDESLYYYFQNTDSITANKKYVTNKDIFEILDERYKYFQDKKEFDILPIISKAYIDRAIARYGMLLKVNDRNISDLKDFHNIFCTFYKKEGRLIKGYGYKIFKYFPKLYFLLVNMKDLLHG